MQIHKFHSFTQGKIPGWCYQNRQSLQQVVFKDRAVGALHDHVHILLRLIFELVRPFCKGHEALI